MQENRKIKFVKIKCMCEESTTHGMIRDEMGRYSMIRVQDYTRYEKQDDTSTG